MAIDTVTATGKVTATEMDTATVMPVDMAKGMAVNMAAMDSITNALEPFMNFIITH